MRARVALCLVVAALVIARPSSAQGPRLVHGGSPAVSPDGRYIAFAANREGPIEDIYVITADGSGEVRLTHTPAEKGRPAWTSDGSRVVFSTFVGDTGRVFTVRVDGQRLQQVAAVPGRNPILLNDGRSVLYATGDWVRMQLSAARLDGTGRRQLSSGVAAVWNAALAPDGKRIAYTGRDTTGHLQVWVMNLDGTGARAVTHFPEEQGRAQCPAWSADGRWLAIQANSVDPEDSSRRFGHIWTIDLGTDAATKLAPHDQPYLDELPSWFPDGKRLAFQSDRSGRTEIWVMNSDGTGPRQVTR